MNVLPTQMLSVASFANTPAVTTAPAHVDDIAQFRQTFADATPANQVQSGEVTPVTHELGTGFRAVLDQFDSLNGHASKLGKMAEAMRSSGRDLAPSQIIDMTMQCQQMVFQAQLTSNVANRSSDGLQQLFRHNREALHTMVKRLMGDMASRLAVLILVSVLLAGCSRDVLYAHLDEQQANDVSAALINNGIDAEKRGAERGNDWQVLIDRAQIPAAVAVLRDAGLPHQSTDNYTQMFKKDGFMSSPLEDKQRFIYAREQELGHTLRQLDGVVEASVYLSMPDKDPLSDKPPSGSASVVIIARPNAGIESRASDIKATVMTGTEGLTDPSRVNVQFFQRAPTEVNPNALRAGQGSGLLRGDAASWLLIGFGILAVLLAALLLWRNRSTLLGHSRDSAHRGLTDER